MVEEEAFYTDEPDAIGEKIIEMADRVKVFHSVMPGSQATWVFEMDDVLFRVVVSVAERKPDAVVEGGK